MDAIVGVGSLDWNALVCRENEGILGYALPKPPPKVNPSPRAGKNSLDCSSLDDSKKGSSRLSLGGASSKRRHSRKAEGSSHCSSSKKRKKKLLPLLLGPRRRRRL